MCVFARLCVCVFVCLCVCVYVCAFLRFPLLCLLQLLSCAKGNFPLSPILCLPRAALGVLQPGLRGGPRRDLIGAKETRRAPPGEALAG